MSEKSHIHSAQNTQLEWHGASLGRNEQERGGVFT